MSAPKTQKLVPGVDYYMEGPNIVFTADFHRKRGTCCNSKCRHCPYRDAAESAPALQILGLPTPRAPEG